MATPGLGAARTKILSETFEKKGGVIVTNLRDLKQSGGSAEARVIVICSEASLRESPKSAPSLTAIAKHLKLPKLSRQWELHTVEWLTESNSKQTCLGPDDYTVAPLLARLIAEDEMKQQMSLVTAAEKAGMSDDEDGALPVDTAPMTPEQAMAHNAVLVEKLEELARVHRVRAGKEDLWRGITFSKAANIVRAYPKPIRRGKDCADIKGLGAKCIEKIDEILKTGSLQRLEVMSKDPKIVTMNLFLTVHGIGPASAAKYWDQGLRTLDDLRTKADLTGQQRLFLAHYDELTSPIPRSEVAEVEQLLIQHTRALNFASKIDVIICGSYRRGKNTSGDIDVLIASHNPDYVPRVSKRLGQSEIGRTLPNASPFLKSARSTSLSGAASASSFLSSVAAAPDDAPGTGESKPDRMILEALVENLERAGFLTEHISLPSDHNERWGQSKNIFDGHENETYMGICRLPGEGRKRRRIDMKVYHVSEIAFAVMYFTGSKEFNRAMRLYANKRFKLSLSDHALTPYEFKNDGTRDKVATGAGLPCYTERDIFEALKLPYLAPSERNGVPANLLSYVVEDRVEELARQSLWREQKTDPERESSKRDAWRRQHAVIDVELD